MPTKRIAIISDLHCGHVAGLTPPGDKWYGGGKLADKTRPLRQELWKWFKSRVKANGPYDIVFANGDLIDGRGERSGGTELISQNRFDQVDMAIRVIQQFHAKKHVITRGTPYHTGNIEDFEDAIAKGLVGSKIGDHVFPEVNGLVFDLKHKVGGSSVPHGRHTAVSKERLWNMLWAEHDQQPKGDVIIRSHVHYHSGAFGTDWLAMTTPALQAAQTKFGARQCSGTVDFGFLVFDIKSNGEYKWHAETIRPSGTKVETIKL